MSLPTPPRIAAARVRLPCAELGPSLAFFEQLGFTLSSIFPADDPARARLQGHGLALELDRSYRGDPGQLVLACEGTPPAPCTAPNGTRISFVPHTPPLELPELQPERVVSRMAGGASWVEGRAGMLYRDLIPSRLGGRYIASHIRIPTGGPVPDYVHYHRVHFQMIYCYRGWVRVVYEDQGEPFVLEPGDCVLQPPTIRHRVLESSAGLEVIELGCPALHETHRELQLELPTERVEPGRLFEGQRFVRHIAREAVWGPSPMPGFDARAIGFEDATSGLAEARVARMSDPGLGEFATHDAELHFGFVLAGSVSLEFEGEPALRLASADAVTIPAGERHRWREASEDFELLEVSLPARPGFES